MQDEFPNDSARVVVPMMTLALQRSRHECIRACLLGWVAAAVCVAGCERGPSAPTLRSQPKGATGSAVEVLPTFRYHPDPVATGGVERSDEQCECCGRKRGYVYASTPYCEAEVEAVCPWCIADGSAHAKWGAQFTDLDNIGGSPWDDVPKEVAEEIAYRTPSFVALQEERWWTHCRDGAEYLGRAGHDEIEARGGVELFHYLREQSEIPSEDWRSLYSALDKDGDATAYLFRCRHCGKVGGYIDFD